MSPEQTQRLAEEVVRLTRPDAEKQSQGELSASADSMFWRVEGRQTAFGFCLNTGLIGLTIVLYRANHGWKVPDGQQQFAKLAHQVYAEELTSIFKDHNVKEIVAVDILHGKWVTLWAITDNQVSYSLNDGGRGRECASHVNDRGAGRCPPQARLRDP